MQYKAKAPFIVETNWQIEEVLDGDVNKDSYY